MTVASPPAAHAVELVTTCGQEVLIGVLAADLDCTNGVDLLIPTLSGTVEVLLNNGTGTFGAPLSFGPGKSAFKIAVADFDRNGAPDWAVANWQHDTVSVSLNCVAGACLRVNWLLRNDVSSSVAPLTPSRGELFSRMSQGLFIEDGWVEGFIAGDVDPDPTVLAGPLPFVLYQVTTQETLKLVKDQGSIRIHF